MSVSWLKQPMPSLNAEARQAARERQNQLTKPRGSLGVLETLVERLAAIQGTHRPSVDPAWISIFAADHGVAADGVSAYPQAVTVEMIRNFSRGGAAISVLARSLGAPLEVVDVGAIEDPGPLPGVISRRVGPGTANLRHEPAMTPQQLSEALNAGREAVERALKAGSRLFIGGEMGIGNSTSAAAISAVLLGLDPTSVSGPGTGLDEHGMARKAEVIQEAWDQHEQFLINPLETLRILGGFEIAALCGAYISCGQNRLAALVDGTICTAAALVAVSLHPPLMDWLIFAHRSAEPGHFLVLRSLNAQPILNLDMKLGEATGAATAYPLLRLACALQSEMATFEEAQVSQT